MKASRIEHAIRMLYIKFEFEFALCEEQIEIQVVFH